MEQPRILTCWKDVAVYMGKGVRTVQRWEHDFGLPVRRPATSYSKATVSVDIAELDVWRRANFHTRNASEVQQLNWDLIKRSAQLIAESGPVRNEHTRLIQESRQLRSKLEELRQTKNFLCIGVSEPKLHSLLSPQQFN